MTLTDADLKELCDYLTELITQAHKDEDEASEDAYIELQKQLQVIHYSAMLFEDICAMYQVDFSVATLPMEDLPLYMFDEQPIIRAIVKWRLSRGN